MRKSRHAVRVPQPSVCWGVLEVNGGQAQEYQTDPLTEVWPFFQAEHLATHSR
jgi:hypothetical protein